MISGFLKKIFGSRNDRLIRQYGQAVRAINALEPAIGALSDEQLRGKTGEFRQKLAAGAPLDDLLPEAFAVVREAGKRALGMRHFDVQLIGGMVLHDGKIAEMRTGEGKTLVATLPAYLNALSGQGVHVITVNDYLASRDAEWMGKLYAFLGMSVGVNLSQMAHEQKQAAYAADITYGTNNEFGFDYLRDNMVYAAKDRVQKKLGFAIVDEVDSILIDEARTPLIISGQAEDHTDLYLRMNQVAPLLTRQQEEKGEGDFWVDEKAHTVLLSEAGHEHAEEILARFGLLTAGGSLYEPANILLMHHLYAALRAHNLFHRDQHYVSQNGEIVIVDEFTGRLMPGRRWSEGLHQAVEAKEGVPIQHENQTLASITFQNYFRMYSKLGGMTGTASTEAEEFGNIYGLEVVEVPTNLPIQRLDEDDEVYRTVEEKYKAIIQEIKDASEKGQPVLVGTTSIEKSEYLAERLKMAGFKGFQVLNARYHEQEAYIVSQAGVPGAVTIATNMAGRGTDIQLGGNLEMRIERDLAEMEPGPERDAKRDAIVAEVKKLKEQALAAGGLYVLATERHESRRIDNQLRGRSGRQGDPGRSKFFLSLQDDLMRIFGSERMDSMLQKLGLKDGEAIVHPWINKALERAQKKVEARNFDIRKNLLKYDDVLNDQRKVIFEQRIELMDGENLSEIVADMRNEVVENLVRMHIPENAYAEQWDVAGLKKDVLEQLNLDLPIDAWAAEEGIDEKDILERLHKATDQAAADRAERFGPEIMTYVERSVLLQTLDHLWREHIVNLDHLRSVIGFRGYAQRDPLQEYKAEAFELFQALLANLRQTVTSQLMRVELVRQAADAPSPVPPEMEGHHIDGTTGEDDFGEGRGGFMAVAAENRDPNDPSTWGHVARNEPCPCGSGKKYKHCHGAFEQA